MSQFAKQLKEMMISLGVKQKEIAKFLSMTPTAVSDYAAGKREPALDIIIKLAERYGVSLTWLLTGKGEMLLYNDRARERGAPLVSIPVVADIAAGTGIEAFDLPPTQIIEVSPNVLTLPGPYWAFQVDGISMEPELHTGDIAIVTRDWYNIDYRGMICAFRIPEGLVIKRLMMPPKSKTAYLIPININSPIITYHPDDPDIIMLGVLVAVLRKYN